MNVLEKMQVLNWDLLAVCERIVDTLKPDAKPQNIFLYFSLAFLLKATRTLRAVNLLYFNNLPEQAQALVRVLFELRVTYDYFLVMAKDDKEKACKLINDTTMLEKIKQMKASSYAGIGDSVRKRFENYEKEIGDDYSQLELKKIRRYGFTGLSVEQRAQITGNEQEYNIVYRNFSRNIHSTDFAESFRYINGTEQDEYVESRNFSSLYIARFSASGIALQVNDIFQCGFDAELQAIIQKARALNRH